MNLGYDRGIEDGDSGEELGEVSGAEGESKVETVVVGEESVEPDVIEDTLSRWWKGSGRREDEGWAEPCEGTRSGWSGAGLWWWWSLSLSLSGSRDEIPPKTDIKEGNESGCDGALVWMGIVGFRTDLRLQGEGDESLSESQQSWWKVETKTDAPLLHRDR